MDKIWILIKREFKAKVMTRSFIISTVVTPLLVLGFAFGPVLLMKYAGENPIVMGYVDYSGLLENQIEPLFPDTLKNGQPRFHLVAIPPARFEQQRELYRQRIQKGELDVILVIPAEVAQNRQITYLSKSVSDLELIQSIRSRIADFLNRQTLQASGLEPQLIEELTRKVDVKTIKVTKEGETEKGVGEEFGTVFVFLFILYFTLIFYGVAIMQGVLEEKTSRIVEILLSSANAFQLMMGKLLGLGSAGLAQYLIWALLAVGAFAVTAVSAPSMLQFVSLNPVHVVYFIIFFVLGFFLYSTLYLAGGALSTRQEDLQSFSMPITMLVVLPFIVAVTVGIRNPSGHLTDVLSFIPFFTPLLMFLRVMLVSPPLWQVWLSIILNGVTAVILVWVTARIFRVGILMYGKRPTLPEVVRWIRYQ